MTLNDAYLKKLLAPRPVRFYDLIDSSNDAARQWLREGAPDGAVVIADEQTRGRGRLGRGWQTPPGTALAVSVILHPSPDHLSRLSMLGALAIAELAEQAGAPDVGIKWPNDVQIGGLKLSGVLPEAEWDGDRLTGVVLGMGLNVRVDFRGSELEGQAISLETVTHMLLDRAALIRQLLGRIDHWYEQLASDALFAAWRSRLSTPGQFVTIGNVTGTAESVDAGGALLVRDSGGSLHRVMAGDLVMGVAQP